MAREPCRRPGTDLPAAPGQRALRADLATGEGLSRLPRQVAAVVFCAAPDRRDEAAYRALYLDGLRRLLDACEVDDLDPLVRGAGRRSTAACAQRSGEERQESAHHRAHAPTRLIEQP